jgi:hypothetical protein
MFLSDWVSGACTRTSRFLRGFTPSYSSLQTAMPRLPDSIPATAAASPRLVPHDTVGSTLDSLFFP